MKKNNNRAVKIILWVLTISWLFLIIWESSEIGIATAKTSYRVAEFVIALFRLPASKISRLDHFLRTIMHFVNFFVLGGFAYAISRITWYHKKYVALWVILVCSTVAILDEVKKFFITGRHLSWSEAGLNCIGVVVGVFIMKLFFFLKNHRKL